MDDSKDRGLGAFLARKNVVLSLHRYGVEALGAMALGLFSSLIVGLILRVLGEQLGISFLVEVGLIAAKPELVGAAIGVAVAFGLKAPPLVMFASAITGAAGFLGGGGPAGAFVAAVMGTELGKMVSKETKVDLVVTPAATLIVGIAAAALVGPTIGSMMRGLGNIIMVATELHPIPMGALVAVLMGLALTAPISSAALAIMMELGGIAAGAATVGCAAQMVGFAVISYRENGTGGLISQGLGTSMLQIPNIVKNPRILIPPTLAGAILGPFVTTLFPMVNLPIGAGMGTAGLVGQFATVEAMGTSALPLILVFHFIAPALLSLFFAGILRKASWIKEGDLKLNL